MKILELFNSNWAIYPPYYDGMLNTYENHMVRAEKVDFESLINKMQSADQKLFRKENGTAVIPIKGPLSKGSSLFSFYFDASSTKVIQAAIEAALNDSEINKIILDIDSPGGTVDGSFELADFINNAKREKPIIAFSDGMIASAAYLIAASADSISITGKTNQVGSIGVIARHVDFSEMDLKDGIKVSEFVTGKYKNLFSSTRPLEDFARDEIQKQIDFIFSIFIADIVDRRSNLNIEQIVGFEGNILIGPQSIEAGLVDNVSTLDSLIMGNAPENSFKVETMDTETKITLEKLMLENPELVEKIEAEGGDVGAKAERQRINDIREMAFPGQEEIVDKMINDNKTVAEAALIFNAAQKAVLKAEAEVITSEKPDPVQTTQNQDQTEETGTETKTEDFMTLVKDYKKENSVDLREAMAVIGQSHPEAHEAFLKGVNPGKSVETIHEITQV